MEIFGLILLALNIWALINIWTSGAETLAKVLWTIGIWIAPFIGFILWFFIGPKRGSALA